MFGVPLRGCNRFHWAAIDLPDAEEGDSASDGDVRLLFVIVRFIGMGSVGLLRSGDNGGTERPRVSFEDLIGSR